MDGCIGKYYSEGLTFRETAFLPESLFETGKCYYEVLRVMNKTCLFLKDHLNRLNRSVRLSGLSYPLRFETVSAVIRKLILENNLVSGNIRLVLQVKEPDPPVLYTCCVPYSYPEAVQYEQGVSTAVYRKVRMNPNVKQYYPQYLQQIQEFIKERRIYEALLSDEQGLITEGSKSNVFFIRNQMLFTAPGKTVLKGITREKVIRLCKELNYKVIERAVSCDSLDTMESVFLTGTSPKVLPVRHIEEKSFSVDHPVMTALMAAYDRLILLDMERSRSV